MNRRLSNSSIPISLLLIASFIYQLPVVGTARFRPANATVSSDTNSLSRANVTSLPTAVPNSISRTSVIGPAYVPFFAPSLTASLADDIGLGAKKNPGDTITYTATITNGGASPADDATGMVFSAILDINTTLVGGSINAQPIAKPDSYTGSGNIPISIAAPGVLTNDVDPMTGTNTGLTVTEVQGSPANVGVATDTTAVGGGLVKGSVTLATNGSFTYEPPPGYVGNDTFTYKTSEGTLTDTNTVTITISNMVWFIRNTGGGSNRGTFSNPFTSIASFNSANALADAAPNPKSGDFIALRSGTYAEADGVNLRGTQKLIGEAVQFNTVFTADSNSSAAYTTFAGATNTAPAISTSAGNGIDLASGNTVRGLNVGNTPGFFGFNGTAVGSPVINTVAKTGTGGAINITTSGAFGANVTFGTLESSSSPGANINLVSVTGTLGITSGGTGLTGSAASSNVININGGSVGFTYPGNVTKASLGALLNVSGGHTGTLTFNTGTLSATAGTGLQFDNGDGAYNFNGTTTLNGGDAGVDILNGSGGSFSFTSGATITNPTGIAFNVSASAPSLTYAGNITANNNRAVSISNGAAAACGTQTFSTGSITGSGASASGILVNNCNSGTIAFSGSAQTLTTQANNGVTLTNNGGAAINFTGGNLDVITTTGKPFTATGGGTISVTGAGNTLATESDGAPAGGMILEVTDTTSGGITFATVTGHGGSATTKGVFIKSAGSGGVTLNGGSITNYTQKGIHVDSSNNITLNNITLTGNSTADLDTPGVCGDAANISNSNCAANIDLQNVTTVSLTSILASGSQQIGINGRNVANLSMTNVEVTGNGNHPFEDGVQLTNLTGTSAWTGLNFHDNTGRQLEIQNNTGTNNITISSPTFTNVSFPPAGNHQQAVLFSGKGTANMTLVMNNVTIARNRGAALHSDVEAGASANVTINGGTLIDNGQHFSIGMGGTSATGTLNYTLMNISSATVNPAHTNVGPIAILKGGNTTGNMTGTISGNTFGTPGVAFSGSPCISCVIIDASNGSADAGLHKVSITNNFFRESGHQAINIAGGGDGGANPDSSQIQANITGNSISNPSDPISGTNPLGDQAIVVNIGTGTGDTTQACTHISGNTITGSWAVAAGGGHIRVRNRQSGTALRLPGFTGPFNDVTAAANFVSGQNGSVVTSAQLQNGAVFSGGSPATCFLLLAMARVTSYDTGSYFSEKFGEDQFAVFEKSNVTPGATADIATSLNQQQLDSMVSAAIQRWSEAGLTSRQVSRLRGIHFEVADLGHSYLGEATGKRILVDRDAGGQGWFVDPDPLGDARFAVAVSATRRYPDPTSALAARVDLLTAIEHEMGHRLGLDDKYAAKDRDDLMYGYLTVGERRVPARGQARGVRPGALKGSHFLSLGVAAPPLEMRKVSDLPIWSAGASAARPRFGLPAAPSKAPSPLRSAGALQRKHHATRSAEDKSLAPMSGETVTVNGSGTGFTLPGGDSITITFQATVNTPPGARSVSTQGKVSGSNFTLVNGITTASPNTNDPETGAVNDATVTNIDVLSTWTGALSTNWNDASNWSPTTYAPGVSNPAVNDVVIPNVGNQPTISATDIGVYSLNISSGRTLTIDPARVLTIGGSPGGDLTLDGIISGGVLRFGSGAHAFNNTGGTGSLSATNGLSVISGATVTLNHNLQAGALAVDAGGSLNITGKVLSLNGSGAALGVAGTFTTTGSTIILNGTAAQTIAGTTYNNLTINNTLGAHVTGVTLTGNATVNGLLLLTSSDLATGAFTLTMPNTATSGPASGASDVVGNVKRTGFVSGGSALSFGNPLNTIRINSGTAPTDINVLLAKNAPVTYAAAVQRSYTITPNGGSGINATVRLHYRQAELNGHDDTSVPNFNFRRFTAGAWKAVVPTSRNTGVVEDNWLENNAVTTFSEWTFANLSPSAASGTVRGTITDSHGTPVEGVVVRLSGEQNRKTITDSKGRYYFDNVDVNGFYTVTPSRVNYHFTPFHRAFTQLGNQTEAAFGAVVDSDSQNPLDTPEYFVRQQYVDILGREPDEGGFNYWSDEILSCGNDANCVNTRRSDIAAAFFIEQEFQQTGSYIYNLYKGSLGRRPGYSEYAADRRQVIGGPDLETEKATFAAGFVLRADFVQKYQAHTTAESFVDALLATIWQSSNLDLGTQRGVLLALYQTGSDTNQSRALVLRQVGEDPALKSVEYNPAFVLTEYFGYLRRNPEPEGYDFWLHVLNNREPGNFRGMVCSFITSTEYQQRFSAVVTHSNAECGR